MMPDQFEEIRRRIAELRRCEMAIAYEARIGGDWTDVLERFSSQIASLERAMQGQSATV